MPEERDDQSQKTELPTERRLEEARKKGQVILSKELTHWFMILGMILVVGPLLPSLLKRLCFFLKAFLNFEDIPEMTAGNVILLFKILSLKSFACMGLVFLIFIFMALAGTWTQTRLNISLESLKPNLEKISPLKGLHRVFSKKSLLEFFKSFLKFFFIFCALIFFIRPEFRKLDTLLTLGPVSLAQEIHRQLMTLLLILLGLLTLLAIGDYILQRFSFLREMRMTRQEIKEELKEMEGDPKIKQRQRHLRQERLRQNLSQAIPTATVIITNPTHYAVALRYIMDEMDAPIVVAKGLDHVALRIRELAKDHQIPLYRNPSLAQILYKNVDINQPIQEEHYEAVAKVIRYIMDLDAQKSFMAESS